MAEQFSNNIGSQIQVDMTSVSTSVTVASVAGFPTTPQFRIIIQKELMLVTAMTGPVWTVTRGIEGTTAIPHAAGVTVNHVMSAGGLRQTIGDAVADAVSGAVGSRTLSGPIDPDASLGNDGNFYVNTSTGMFSTKTLGSWSSINVVSAHAMTLTPLASTATSYSNPNGLGDRRTTIVATDSGNFWAQGNVNSLIDGTYIDYKSYFAGGTIGPTNWMKFDFGPAVIIDEVRLVSQPFDDWTGGLWQWYGSNDNTVFVPIGGVWTMATRLAVIQLANTTPYRYYKLVGISGFVLTRYQWQMEFKISLATENVQTLTCYGRSTLAALTANSLHVLPSVVPSSATSSGRQGQVLWDANYVYVCIADNSWKRSPLSTW